MDKLSENIKKEILYIGDVRDQAIKLITNEMNFLNYYESELKKNKRIEFACFENSGALYNLILNVYSVYESSIKKMLIYALEIIDKQNIKVNDLAINLRALYYRDNIDIINKRLHAPNTNKEELIENNIIKIHNIMVEDRDFESKGSMVDTKSNLKFNVLGEIISYFNFDIGQFKDYKSDIESLVHHRNNVAHGNDNFINYLPRSIKPFNEKNYEVICENIIEVIKLTYKNIEDYLLGGKYRFS